MSACSVILSVAYRRVILDSRADLFDGLFKRIFTLVGLHFLMSDNECYRTLAILKDAYKTLEATAF